MAHKVDLTQDLDPLRMLMYGNPGSTKTRTAVSSVFVEDMSPVLYIDASGNPVSVRDYDPQPTIIRIEDLKDVNDPYAWIKGGQNLKHRFARQFEIEEPVRTIIIDQLTDVQRLSFMGAMNAKNIGPGDFPVKREWEHYNKVLYQMSNFAKLYYELPIHVIMVCLEKIIQSEATGRVEYHPSMEGQSAHVVPSYANVVVRMVHKKALRKSMEREIEKALGEIDHSVAFFTPGPNWPEAKDQYGALPQVMIDPSMAEIHSLIYGGAQSSES